MRKRLSEKALREYTEKGQRWCPKCETVKAIDDFYKSKRDGHDSRCKVCRKLDAREYVKTGYWVRRDAEYYKRPDVRKRVNAYQRERRKRPDMIIKNACRSFANHAIGVGKISREPCAVCGEKQSEAHHNDYNQPLLIVWLCPSCHRYLHCCTLKQLVEETSG